MILSASRRTDIPNYYSAWFLKRLEEGFVCVRNPFNPRQVSQITLSPTAIDCIVFWTKNPGPLLEQIDRLQPYAYYFQFTLNPYARDIEPLVPGKATAGLDLFRRLAEKVGRERVRWRYDPVLCNDRYTVEYHLQYFGKLAARLGGYTESCTISFLDVYRHNKNILAQRGIRTPTATERRELAAGFALAAKAYKIKLNACSEDGDYQSFGIGRAACIDGELIERLTGKRIPLSKDRGQRKCCGCAASADIGAYNTCANGCLDCYAQTGKPWRQVSVDSPLLGSIPGAGDIITERKGNSIQMWQQQLF